MRSTAAEAQTDPGLPRQRAYVPAAATLAAFLGIAHATIDAACNFAIARIVMPVAIDETAAATMVMTYNLLAFATQFAIGWLIDLGKIPRLAAITGCILTAIGVAIHASAPLAAIALCGLGNALFHAGAGSIVLQLARSNATHGGLFVGPGDIGVLVGVNAGRRVWPGNPAIFCIAALAAVIPLLIPRRRLMDASDPRPRPQRRAAHALLIPALLAIAIALRSIMGNWIGVADIPAPALLITPFAIACIAKCAGGILSDLFGPIPVAAAACACAIPLLLCPSTGVYSIAALALINLPMAITLIALTRAHPRRPAFAFGMASLWVYLGGSAPIDILLHSAYPWLPILLQSACAASLLSALLLQRRAGVADRSR